MDLSNYSYLFDLIGSVRQSSATSLAAPTTPGPLARREALDVSLPRRDRPRRRRPVGGYASLIAQVLLSAPNRRLMLRQIYHQLNALHSVEFPLRGPSAQSWKNTVRHTLSRYPCFVNVIGSWTIDFSANVSGLCLGHSNTDAATQSTGHVNDPIPVYPDNSGSSYISANNGGANLVHHHYHHHIPITYETAVTGWAY